MVYLYLRYNRKQEKTFSEFEKYLNDVDFTKFNLNENCELSFYNYSVIMNISLFLLDELIFGISNKIYRVKYHKIFLVDESDEFGENQYPKIKSNSGKLFYNSFTGTGKSLDDFLIDVCDLEFLIRLAEDGIILNAQTWLQIFLFYIKSGDIYKCLKFGKLHDLCCQCKKLMGNGEYYPQKHEDEIWNFIEKFSDKAEMIYQIAKYCLNFSTSEENFQKFAKLKFSKITQYSDRPDERLLSFFRLQIYVENSKRLSILNGTIDELIAAAEIRNPNYVTNFLINEVIRRTRNGEQIDRKHGVDFLRGFSECSLTGKQEEYFFNHIFSKEIYAEKNFDNIIKFITRRLFSTSADLAFGILMEKIEFDVTGFNAKNCCELLEGLYNSEKKQKFTEFLLHTSKYLNEDGSYVNTPEGKFFEYVQKYDEKKDKNFLKYLKTA